MRIPPAARNRPLGPRVSTNRHLPPMNSVLRITAAAALVGSVVLAQAPRNPILHDDVEIGPVPRGNVLLMVLDDIGVDQLASYGVGTDLANLPVLDQLTSQGIAFENVWSNSVCSPTRATILTGRYSFRTGIGHTVKPGNHALGIDEILLPEALDRLTSNAYDHAAFGKWHLGDKLSGGPDSPTIAGFQDFYGTMTNVINYYVYEKIEDGLKEWVLGYATSDMVDDTIQWVRERDDRPWFAYVAFHSAHAPYHEPPAGQFTTDLSGAGDPNVDFRPYYKAMLESVDHEIGRLLAGIAPVLDDTTIIIVGDNGTPMECVAPPLNPQKGKASLFQGGINVPMLVISPHVETPGARCSALINTTDLFNTVINLAGVDTIEVDELFEELGVEYDSESVLPYILDPSTPSIRTHTYAEIFNPNGVVPPFNLDVRAIRNSRYKYVDSNVTFDPIYASALFDLRADPLEDNNLLMGGHVLTPQEQAAYDELRIEMAKLIGRR